jgi:hypothetical protein
MAATKQTLDDYCSIDLLPHRYPDLQLSSHAVRRLIRDKEHNGFKQHGVVVKRGVNRYLINCVAFEAWLRSRVDF